MADVFDGLPFEPGTTLKINPVELSFVGGKLELKVDGKAVDLRLVQRITFDLNADKLVARIGLEFLGTPLSVKTDRASIEQALQVAEGQYVPMSDAAHDALLAQWREAFGDPQDPETQKRIQETVARMQDLAAKVQ